MHFSSMLLGLLALTVSTVYGTALTYKLGASEKACFFTNIEIGQAKIAFYFAASLPHVAMRHIFADHFCLRSNPAARSMSITR
jgi:hypothetical protein